MLVLVTMKVWFLHGVQQRLVLHIIKTHLESNILSLTTVMLDTKHRKSDLVSY
jgi:hypothetical protein